MNYSEGQQARQGDVVRLGEEPGVVVFSIDTDEFDAEFPEPDWRYLGHGVMVKFPRYGMIHYVAPEPDLVLVSRKMAEPAQREA